MRSAQLLIAHHRLPGVLSESNAHFVTALADVLLNLKHLEAIPSLQATSARLPMEDGQPDYAWADEQGSAFAINNCGERIYGSLNWRRGFSAGVRDLAHTRTNDITFDSQVNTSSALQVIYSGDGGSDLVTGIGPSFWLPQNKAPIEHQITVTPSLAAPASGSYHSKQPSGLSDWVGTVTLQCMGLTSAPQSGERRTVGGGA